MKPFKIKTLAATVFTSTAILTHAQQSKLPPEQVNPSLIEVPSDLEITTWANTPLFYNPTNMDMDAYGRMWVAEGVNYRGNRKRSPKGDRIMVVYDSNNDGKADKSHCFVQEPELQAPLGVAIFGNRIIVSQPPNLIQYTDVDNNLKFDPKIDKKDILLTGFNGHQHDHSLHAVTAGPDGKWYVNQGNCGARVTDKSGKTYYFGSTYAGGFNKKKNPVIPSSIAGKESDDGFTYIASFIGKMNPDGSNLEIMGHNMRNAYEHTVSSYGDIYHSDNDDPPSCRNTYLLEGGNAGFSSADGLYPWESDRRPGQDTPTAHWRQENPGVMPAGDIYGSGSPTGVAFYENGALPEKYNGMFLACDAARRDIMQYFPRPQGAGMSLERLIFLKAKKSKQAYNFRPSDVEIGADGAIYVADWYDPRVGGHSDKDKSLSGTIYRIAPKGFKSSLRPKFNTIEGQIALLKSPSDNVRYLGFELLKKQGSRALPALTGLLKNKNPYIAARAVWLLPFAGEKGIAMCKKLTQSSNQDMAYTAFNALRNANMLELNLIAAFTKSKSAQLRRTAASALRKIPFQKKQSLLVELYNRWNGKDKYMLEAIGLASHKHEADLWKLISKGSTNPTKWTEKFALMTWRLHPEAALPMLEKRANDKTLSTDQRKLAMDTIAFTKSNKTPPLMLKLVTSSPEKEYARMWLDLNIDGKRWDGLVDRNKVAKIAKIPLPGKAIPFNHPKAPNPRTVSSEREILKLKGNIKNGALVANRCKMCHEIGGSGINFGPGLNGWGLERSKEQILTAIVNPDADIAHGFKGHTVTLKSGKTIDGLVKSSTERPRHYVHSNKAKDKKISSKNFTPYLTIVTSGGNKQKISWLDIKGVKTYKRSLMLYPEQIGLTRGRDLADLIAYLQQLK